MGCYEKLWKRITHRLPTIAQDLACISRAEHILAAITLNQDAIVWDIELWCFTQWTIFYPDYQNQRPERVQQMSLNYRGEYLSLSQLCTSTKPSLVIHYF